MNISANLTRTAEELSYCSRKMLPNQRPTVVEVFLLPFLVFLIMIGGMVLLVTTDSKKYKRSKRVYQTPETFELNAQSLHINQASVVKDMLGSGKFYTNFDKEVLLSVRNNINTMRDNLITCIPMFIALLMSTVTLFLYEPLVDCMWPEVGRPDINTTVTCFLLPAGLVYALSFGFVFQQALVKQGAILDKISTELSLIDQLLTMAVKLKLPSKEHCMAILKAAKSEAIFIAMLVQNREPSSFKNKAPPAVKVEIWNIVEVLRQAAQHPEYSFELNEILVKQIINYIIQLNNICADRMGSLQSRIHPLKWVFLEILGGLALFGVMLIDASSRRMELAMCHLTLFSVSMLCYVLADLDSPFNGFFRVDLSVIPDVVRRAEKIYEMVKNDEKVDLSYPLLTN